MKVAVKNNSPAKQGVSTDNGTVWIRPGGTKTIEVESTAQIDRLPFLEIAQVSDDGVPVGDLPAPPKSLLDKAKGKGKPVIPTLDEVLSAEVVDDRPPATMKQTKPELLKIAKAEKVEVETDDNKSELVRKINAAREAA